LNKERLFSASFVLFV